MLRRHPALWGGLLAGGALLALANHRAARAAERRRPPRGKFIVIDGVRLHYLEAGVGPCVVLLHGNGAMAEDFKISGLFDLLAKDFRVIAFDRPGFGFSDRPRCRRWSARAQAAVIGAGLTRLAVERPIVVGHSWGTLVALELAMQRQPHIAALVLLGGYYFPRLRWDATLLSWTALPVLGDVWRYTLAPLLSRACTPAIVGRIFAPTAVPQRFVQEFPIGLAVRPRQLGAVASDTALMVVAAARLSGRYAESSLPVRLVAGAQDKIVSTRRQTDRLARQLPCASAHVFPGGGHMIHYDAPQEIAALISELGAHIRPAGIGNCGPEARIAAEATIHGTSPGAPTLPADGQNLSNNR